uniref:Uncharacterized protein n=1 Tax=Pyricularia oryzae (strain P131) TaxID=1143193 RepID=L7JP96_PYRO1
MPLSVIYVWPTRSEDWNYYQGAFEKLYKDKRLKDVMDTRNPYEFRRGGQDQFRISRPYLHPLWTRHCRCGIPNCQDPEIAPHCKA